MKKSNTHSSEVEEILNPPVASTCGTCQGVGYHVSAVSNGTDLVDGGYQQLCSVCYGRGRVGFSPELAKEQILALIDKAVQEARLNEVKRIIGKPKKGEIGYTQLKARLKELQSKQEKEG